MTAKRRSHKVAHAAPARNREVEQYNFRHNNRKGSKRTHAENVFNFNNYVHEQRKKQYIELIPKSLKQEEYIDLLQDENRLIVLATGPAGTGKTMLAVMAAIKAYKEGVIDKIIITRPAVGVDEEQHGFLPGDLNQKMEPWCIPIFDVLAEYFTTRELNEMLDEKNIEIAPLAFMRGRNLKHAYVICDEMQNASTNQLKMVLTRLAEGSKMIITGDLQQMDRKFKSDNGLMDFVERLEKSKSKAIAICKFDVKDVQRHPVVAEVLRLYGEE